jgi:mono/diheme cytochrome c family protein
MPTLQNRVAAGLVVAFALTTGPAAADPANGERLARRWCAACHVVASDQRQASADAPPFATIARAPDFSVGKIALYLLDPHPKMPEMALTRREAADIADYMAKVGKAP